MTSLLNQRSCRTPAAGRRLALAAAVGLAALIGPAFAPRAAIAAETAQQKKDERDKERAEKKAELDKRVEEAKERRDTKREEYKEKILAERNKRYEEKRVRYWVEPEYRVVR